MRYKQFLGGLSFLTVRDAIAALLCRAIPDPTEEVVEESHGLRQRYSSPEPRPRPRAPGERRDALHLDRPLRVCGMVRNDGASPAAPLPIAYSSDLCKEIAPS